MVNVLTFHLRQNSRFCPILRIPLILESQFCVCLQGSAISQRKNVFSTKVIFYGIYLLLNMYFLGGEILCHIQYTCALKLGFKGIFPKLTL